MERSNGGFVTGCTVVTVRRICTREIYKRMYVQYWEMQVYKEIDYAAMNLTLLTTGIIIGAISIV